MPHGTRRPKEPVVYPEMPARLRKLLSRMHCEGDPLPDDDPAASDELDPWANPCMWPAIDEARGEIRSIPNRTWRRMYRERCEADHLEPDTIRRGIHHLKNPAAAVYVVHKCTQFGGGIPLLGDD
jgi:hypothetical protein